MAASANGEHLSERVARLEAHHEHTATREDVLRGIQETKDKVATLETAIEAIKGAVTALQGQMATKAWFLGGALAVVIFLTNILVRWLAP